MKIENAVISMQGSHHSLVREERRESLSFGAGSAAASSRQSLAVTASEQSHVSISLASQHALALEQMQGTMDAHQDMAAAEVQAALDDSQGDPLLSLLKSMIEMLTGRRIRTFSAEDLPARPEMPERLSAARPPPRQTDFSYERHQFREEIESSQFSAQGIVRTSDGQEIRFQLELRMERHWRMESHESVSVGAPKTKDPLVVNFAGTAAKLLDRRFRFDLDNDGQMDILPLLAEGSGYLAFDRNRNGRVDTGVELFGPQRGQGFAELAALDADGNGWIDAADPLFAALRIWRPARQGSPSELQSLDEAGVRAIGLAHRATPFAIRGVDNQPLGEVRSTGIALGEQGALSVQELDLHPL